MAINQGASKLMQAFHSMSSDAAQVLLSMAQVYAERHPQPVAPEQFLAEGANSFPDVQEIGEMSPAGMCVVRWSDRRITWSNNAYKAYFVDLEQRGANIGMRIDEIVPAFEESGMGAIFERVAATGEAFSASSYRVDLPMGATYWDWSLAVLPTAAGDDISLLIQMNRVLAVSLPVYGLN